MANLMENFLRLHDLNKLLAEARERVGYLKKKRTALYLRKRRVDVQTWMLNSLVDDACRNLKEIRRLRNNHARSAVPEFIISRKLALSVAHNICRNICEKEQNKHHETFKK